MPPRVTSIHLPASLTSIGSYAFCECTALTSIHLPASVTSIFCTAFSGCPALASIHLPAGASSLPTTDWNSDTPSPLTRPQR